MKADQQNEGNNVGQSQWKILVCPALGTFLEIKDLGQSSQTDECVFKPSDVKFSAPQQFNSTSLMGFGPTHLKSYSST